MACIMAARDGESDALDGGGAEGFNGTMTATVKGMMVPRRSANRFPGRHGRLCGKIYIRQ